MSPGISLILSLCPSPPLQSVPSILTTFSVDPGSICTVTLATRNPHPYSLLRSLRLGMSALGNHTVELQACIGVHIASIQALFDILSSQKPGLIVSMDVATEGLMCVLVSDDPVVTVSFPWMMYTLNSVKTEDLSELEVVMEGMDYYLLGRNESIWTLADVVGIVGNREVGLEIVLRDMIRFPERHGNIGKIAKTLDLKNETHRRMMENYLSEVWGDRVMQTHNSSNSAVFEIIAKCLLTGKTGKLMCLVQGETHQIALFLCNIAPPKPRQRVFFQGPSSHL